MAEAARTVKYQVSDFLKDRHPYNRDQGFETQRERDAGKVFNGFDMVGIDQLLVNVLNPDVDATQRAVALRHLLSHSASAEKKVVLIRKGIVGMLASVMTSKKGQVVLVESLVHQVLRSLCVIPQGCVAVMEEGGLPILLQSLSQRTGGTERDEARLHAATVLSQISGNVAGRSWLLGVGNSKDFELLERPVAALTAVQKEQAADDVLHTLVSILETDKSNSRLLQQAARCFATISLVEEGLHRSLIAGGIRAIAKLLESFAKDDHWLLDESCSVEIDTVTSLITYVWHCGLDPVGLKEAFEQPTLLSSLSRLLRVVTTRSPKLSHFTLKAAVAGAMGALVLHPDLKRSATQAVDDFTPADALVQLLEQIDGLVMEVLHASKRNLPLPFLTPTLNDLTAITKNCVQSLRLLAELPAGRELLHKMLPNDDEATEKVRRMTFYGTTWQSEFNVKVY